MGSRLEKNSAAVRKRIESHTFEDEKGDEYEPSSFGGFPEYFRRKKIKLQNLDVELRAQSAGNPPIFRGIVAHVNGYTQPSLNDLHRIIVTHGGGFMQYLDGKTTVTHILASNLTPKKAEEFKRYRIVKPAWIVDSVKAGRLLPWDNYRVVDETAGQKILRLENGQVSTQANTRVRSYREQTDTSWYTAQINKKAEQDLAPEADIAAEPDEVANSDTRDVVEEVETSALPDSPTRAASEDAAEESDTPYLEDSNAAGTNSILQPSDMRHNDIFTGVTPSEQHQRTAEEHNAKLLADPYVRKSSTLNPEFLQQYYRESRLHHLSTWKSELKSQMQAMAAEQSNSQKARTKPVPGARRYILHVDFDSFFAAVSMKKHPEFADMPVVVAHGRGTGSEIASCNYPARKFGVKNGMWMKRALELCSDLKVLAYDFPAYEEASRHFYEAVIATGGVVQSVSIDEALVDVSSMCLAAGGTDGLQSREGSIDREQACADEIARKVREKIMETTGCAVSVGIGGSILVAKCALRKAKPAGQHQVKPEEELDFLAPLEVQALPGVAWSIGRKLEEMNIKIVKDIRDLPKERLINMLGPKTGEKLHNFSRGIDRTEVGDQVVRKSVSAEVNWGVRFETQDQAEEFVDSLCGELNRRLLKEQVKGRQMSMKIMKRAADAPLDPPKHLGHGKCDVFNKSVLFGVATNAQEALSKEAIAILRHFAFSPGELRGLGVQMQKLEPIGAKPSDSSQKRLQFKTGPAELKRKQAVVDDIEEQPITPKKPRSALDTFVGVANSPTGKPLNITGTQFLLPTQVDPEALNALPKDIRDRLAKKNPQEKSDIPVIKREISSGARDFFALPSASQLDPEILAALPDDVRTEIQEYYRTSPRKGQGQALLPQSPRKLRTIPEPRRATRGRPKGNFLSRIHGANANSTLTQSSFVTTAFSRSKGTEALEKDADTALEPSDLDLSPEFLAALPEDIRREVLDEAHRERLKRNSGLQVQRKHHSHASRQHVATPHGSDSEPEDSLQVQRFLALAPREPKPTFTTRQLSTLSDLRDALIEWYREFREEGPYTEDVEALAKYLTLVVQQEKDMAKATKTVAWMRWVVEEGIGYEIPNSPGFNTATATATGSAALAKAQGQWIKAFEQVRDSVKDAVRSRGLGTVRL